MIILYFKYIFHILSALLKHFSLGFICIYLYMWLLFQHASHFEEFDIVSVWKYTAHYI